MKKQLLIALVLIGSVFVSQAQNKLMCRNGSLSFNCSTPGNEITAINNQVVASLDKSTGDFAVEALIKSFQFKVTLLQEHFNENYMESDKFPKTGFKGKITNLSEIKFDKDGTYKTTVSGQLTIHNKTNNVSTTGTTTVKGKIITCHATFTVKPKDYLIVIPALVENKVAKETTITVDVSFQ